MKRQSLKHALNYMVILNLGQDVAIKTKSYHLYQAVGMCRYSSLININPSGTNEASLFHFQLPISDNKSEMEKKEG